jgi:hypothetical protein
MTDNEIRIKKGARAATRGHCTRDINKANSIMESEEPNLTELEAIVDRLNSRKNKL